MFNQIDLKLTPSWTHAIAVSVVLVAMLSLQHKIFSVALFWSLAIPQIAVAILWIYKRALLLSPFSPVTVAVNPESKRLRITLRNGEQRTVSKFQTLWLTSNLVGLHLVLEDGFNKRSADYLLLDLNSKNNQTERRRLKVLLKHNYFKDELPA